MRQAAAPLIVVFLAACGAPAQAPEPDSSATASTAAEANAAAEAAAISEVHFGGCILTSPGGEVPADLYAETAVTTSDEYPPFTKKLGVNGITLIAPDEVPDGFMELVARTIREIFARNASTDVAAQDELVRNLYRYRTVIPVPLGDDGMDFLRDHEEAWSRTESANSICDIIMAGLDRGQVMEVIEHILHFVSDMGLHYTFPDEWGLQGPSALRAGMDKAVADGYYVIGSYDDIDDDEVRDRVLLQEFAYWVISTAWNLQADYGPKEEEWSIVDEADLRAKLPELYDAYARTVGVVMVAPSLETLREIGPTRAEEGRR